MNGRSTASTLAMLTLLSAALAGCLEVPSFLTSTDAEVAAAENKDLADNAAMAWNPEAVLVAVTTFEASHAHAEQSMGLVAADPTVGNGRALLWFYAYQTPTADETRIFRVDADGRIQVENTSMLPMAEVGQVDALKTWSVDSDKAVEVARGDERFVKALGAENASMVAAIGHHEGGAKWALVAMSETKMVAAAVDATTGELIMVEEMDAADFDIPTAPVYTGAVAMPTPFHLEGSGVVGGGASAEFPFTYPGPAQPAVLHVAYQRDLPVHSARWSLLDPTGETVAEGNVGRFMSMSGEQMFELELAAAGDYVLLFEGTSRAPLPVGSGLAFEFKLDAPGPVDEEEED